MHRTRKEWQKKTTSGLIFFLPKTEWDWHEQEIEGRPSWAMIDDENFEKKIWTGEPNSTPPVYDPKRDFFVDHVQATYMVANTFNHLRISLMPTLRVKEKPGSPPKEVYDEAAFNLGMDHLWDSESVITFVSCGLGVHSRSRRSVWGLSVGPAYQLQPFSSSGIMLSLYGESSLFEDNPLLRVFFNGNFKRYVTYKSAFPYLDFTDHFWSLNSLQLGVSHRIDQIEFRFGTAYYWTSSDYLDQALLLSLRYHF